MPFHPMRPETLARRARERLIQRAAQREALTRRLQAAVLQYGPDSIYPELLREHLARDN